MKGPLHRAQPDPVSEMHAGDLLGKEQVEKVEEVNGRPRHKPRCRGAHWWLPWPPS